MIRIAIGSDHAGFHRKQSLSDWLVSEGYRVRLSGPWPAYRFGGLPSERVASA